MQTFQWTDDWSVGLDSMDETHHEFVACVNSMLCAGDECLASALEAFIEHARQHFAQEDEAMRASGYESAGCHVDEHAAVLRSADEVRLALQDGRVHVVRSFAGALANWFPEHARVMDLGLARWVVQKRMGGAPIVIRPRAAQPA